MTKRQTLELTISIDFDLETARALPGRPGNDGPDPVHPETGLALIAEELRADLLAWATRRLAADPDSSRIDARIAGIRTRTLPPYDEAYGPF